MKDQVRLTPQQREFLEERGLSAAFMKEVAQRRGQDKKPLHEVAFAEGGMTEPERPERPENPMAGQSIPLDTTYNGMSTPDNLLKSRPTAGRQYQGAVEYPDWTGLQPPTGGGEVGINPPTPTQPPIVTPGQPAQAPAQTQYDYSVTRPYLQPGVTSPDFATQTPGQALEVGATAFDPQAYHGFISNKYDLPALQQSAQNKQKELVTGIFGVDNAAGLQNTNDLSEDAKQALKNIDLSDFNAVAEFLNGPGAFADPVKAGEEVQNILRYKEIMGDSPFAQDANLIQSYPYLDVDGDGIISAKDQRLLESGERRLQSQAARELTNRINNSPEVKALQDAGTRMQEEMRNNPEFMDYVRQQQQNQLQRDGITQGAQNLAAGAMGDRESLVKQQQVALIDPNAPGTNIAAGTGQAGAISPVTATTATGTTSDVPTAGTATTYSATAGTQGVRDELSTVTASTLDGLSPEAQVTAQQGELSADAKAKAATMDPNRVQQVISGERVVDEKELAQAQGLDEEAVKAKIANAAVPDNIQAAKTTVQPNEIPEPAQIAESDMAQAQAITSDGLSEDATAVAAKLKAFNVDDATLAEFKEGKIEAVDTVQGQLESLMKSFDDGTPAWAAGAMRAANAAMASRGLGGSSMAAAAIVQATMESAIPIAQADATAFREMKLNNLNRQQQVSLANAAAQQGVKLANFNAEQAAALQNSQNAFNLQSQNLSNMQQAVIANAQIKASLQGQNLTNQQQSNLAEAARYAEVNNVNLSNRQQGLMQDNLNTLQTNLANLSSNQQAYIANANLEAALQGKTIDNKQQTAIANAAKYFEAGNVTFTAEQQAVLHNSNLMSTIGLAELNANQQAILQNATAVASMDMTNLSNRQQAAVQNAQSFLQLDMTNLSNEQQTAMFKAQSLVQSLFNDTAADNAAKQFNASSENQTDQFFSNLISTVNMSNTAQRNSMSQFNAGQENSISSLVANLEAARDQFNANNALVVAQSNATWRQNSSTINTAAMNESLAQFAKDVNALTDGALDEIWQRERDIMSFSVDVAENAKDRALNLLLADKNLESVRKQIAAGEDAAETEMWFTLGLELLKGW